MQDEFRSPICTTRAASGCPLGSDTVACYFSTQVLCSRFGDARGSDSPLRRALTSLRNMGSVPHRSELRLTLISSLLLRPSTPSWCRIQDTQRNSAYLLCVFLAQFVPVLMSVFGADVNRYRPRVEA